MQYIPSRIDSVLENLNRQAEYWQKEAQHRQLMGVKMYELGMQSNRSDLMEQGVNMIERRDTLARPFTPKYSFNYEGSGEKLPEYIKEPNAPELKPVDKYKQVLSDIKSAYTPSGDSMIEDKTGKKIDKLDFTRMMIDKYGIDPVKDKQSYNDIISYTANVGKPVPSDMEGLKVSLLPVKGLMSAKQQEDAMRKERTNAYTENADVVNYNKQREESYNKSLNRTRLDNNIIKAERDKITEIDRKITSKDGQVRADGYREYFEFELDKAGDDYRAQEKAARKFITNMTHLGLHYDDPVLAQGMRVGDLIGRPSGKGSAKEDMFHVQKKNEFGDWVNIDTIALERASGSKSLQAKNKLISQKVISKDDEIRVVPAGDSNIKGLEDAETLKEIKGEKNLKSAPEIEAYINDVGFGIFGKDRSERIAEKASDLRTKRLVPVLSDDGENYTLVKADGYNANGEPYILRDNGKGMVMAITASGSQVFSNKAQALNAMKMGR